MGKRVPSTRNPASRCADKCGSNHLRVFPVCAWGFRVQSFPDDLLTTIARGRAGWRGEPNKRKPRQPASEAGAQHAVSWRCQEPGAVFNSSSSRRSLRLSGCGPRRTPPACDACVPTNGPRLFRPCPALRRRGPHPRIRSCVRPPPSQRTRASESARPACE